MGKIGFHVRWREEIVASSDEGSLVFEYTMGTDHVYFPDEQRWAGQAPAWAKGKWTDYKTAAEEWCKKNNVPFTISDNTFMYEEKKA
jgi:hypothetical protein